MNPERNRLVKEIFADALEQPDAAEREAYLARACGHDAQLREHVQALLQAHEKAGAFLEEPAAVLPGPEAIVSPLLTEKPGDKIGPYKLLQQIGEGGCGVVYMAEQEEPIRRRVALKVIKLGMDTKQVVARFEAERQALALMDHPNIAKVLDAGATDTGRPFFVMELVRGTKLTDYCDENNLATEQRLDLFVQICHAIQHAHQKGIIHRDIKPSNILVTLHDGNPLPKIIDFGIAKATTGQLLTDKTLFTAFEQCIGTPAYMSPEQAEMSTLDIDTRSDIYALGVLLYELLTGQTPFDAQALVAAGLSEMRRIIREQEPLRPSTRISTLAAADQTTVARRRQSEPPQLIYTVRGDLDWIVMKCLEKDRTRRYETANGLAHDILCHLKSDPVLARPPSRLYRFQKLVGRNKLVFTAAAVVSAVLILAVIVSTWQAVRATYAKREAVAAQAQAVEAQANEAKLRQQAQAEELAARQRAYASDMNVANPTSRIRAVRKCKYLQINDRIF
jgi:serine/threonine protein kinase